MIVFVLFGAAPICYVQNAAPSVASNIQTAIPNVEHLFEVDALSLSQATREQDRIAFYRAR
jgi:hypothetical protein